MIECPLPNKFVFPQDEPNGMLPDKFQRHGGLELRDYFAAQALMAMIPLAHGLDRSSAFAQAAKLSFEMADAMMMARQQGAPHEA